MNTPPPALERVARRPGDPAPGARSGAEWPCDEAAGLAGTPSA